MKKIIYAFLFLMVSFWLMSLWEIFMVSQVNNRLTQFMKAQIDWNTSATSWIVKHNQ